MSGEERSRGQETFSTNPDLQMKDIGCPTQHKADTSHSSGLEDSRTCEASQELLRAQDVKSTGTRRKSKVHCGPVRPNMNGVNAMDGSS